MLAFFLTHEVDAAFRHEWRLLPFASFTADDIGREVVTWIHVPLFFLVLLLSDRASFRAGLASFSIVHMGLHWLLRDNPANEFDNLNSWLLVIGAGSMGAIYLIQILRDPPGAKKLRSQRTKAATPGRDAHDGV